MSISAPLWRHIEAEYAYFVRLDDPETPARGHPIRSNFHDQLLHAFNPRNCTRIFLRAGAMIEARPAHSMCATDERVRLPPAPITRALPALGETLEKAEIDFRFRLPSRRFNRAIGSFAGHSFDPEGRPLAAEEFDARRDEWLPGSADRRHLAGLRSEAVTEPGRMANWIAPPRRGVDGRAPDFEYVRSD